MSDFGFDVFDLTGAAPAGEPLAALHFDREEYTPFEQLLSISGSCRIGRIGRIEYR